MVQPLIAVRHPVRLVRVDTSGWTSVARRAPSGENGCPVAHLITPVTAEDITGAVAGTDHMFQAGLPRGVRQSQLSAFPTTRFIGMQRRSATVDYHRLYHYSE